MAAPAGPACAGRCAISSPPLSRFWQRRARSRWTAAGCGCPSTRVRRTPEDERLWRQVGPLLQRERFRPPRVRDIASDLGVAEAAVRRVMKLLARMGRVEEIAHDHFFLRTTVAEMVGIAAAIAASKP